MAEGFFDVHQRLTAAKRATKPASAVAAGAAVSARTPLTVVQLTAMIDKAIKTGVPGSILVKGEISNFNRHGGSGHCYFTLKEGTAACIDCVMWKDRAAALNFTPTDGMELLASGRVQVFAARGKYQFYADSLHPVGQGALELAFQQLRAKLQAQGLFARERKRALRKYPLRIALVTSRSTAALQDILKVLQQYPFLHLALYDVPVQGEGSAEKIAAAIERINSLAAPARDFDVIVLSRGGGSLEDLWEFNEEIVARAIFGSRIPIITGIGHEVDVSIADLVADYHAHTPTEAARVLVGQWETAADVIDSMGIRLRRGLRNNVQDARQRLVSIQRHEFFRRPLDRVNQFRQLLDDRQRTLSLAIDNRLRRSAQELDRLNAAMSERHPRHAIALGRQRVDSLDASVRRVLQEHLRRLQMRISSLDSHLRAIGPEQVLQRGYTITTLKKQGSILRSAAHLKGGERLLTRFAEGSIESIAQDPNQPGLFE